MLRPDAAMRFSIYSMLLLVAAVAAGGVAVAGCSSPAPNEEEEPALTDDELNGRIGLKLVYDEPTSRLHATLRSKLRASEKLLMRVRRGRLSGGSEALVDCSQLSDAPPLPPPATATTTTGTKVVYAGPEVERELLVNVYSQQWIDANISAQMIDRLSREGADSIVEACVVNTRGVRSRLQTSLQTAWDASDPNAAPTLANPNP